MLVLSTLKKRGQGFGQQAHLFQNVALPGFRSPGAYSRNLTTENFASMYIHMGILNRSHRQKKNHALFKRER